MHYKRKKSRINQRGGQFSKWKGKKLQEQGYWDWMGSWPLWWDIIKHRRPHRRKAAEITNSVLRGYIDADEAVWPLHKKPHQYWW